MYYSFSFNINVLLELLPCTQLQDLYVFPGSTVTPTTAHVAADDFPPLGQFLPNLKTFNSYICFGEWSPLFECHRPLLTVLLLSCPHLGWIDVPLLWPNLRDLRIYKGEGLTVEVLYKIAAQLKHLQKLKLPSNILVSNSEEEVQRFKDFASQLRGHTIFPSGPSIRLIPPLSYVINHN
jgi:hypothetical protein